MVEWFACLLLKCVLILILACVHLRQKGSCAISGYAIVMCYCYGNNVKRGKKIGSNLKLKLKALNQKEGKKARTCLYLVSYQTMVNIYLYQRLADLL